MKMMNDEWLAKFHSQLQMTSEMSLQNCKEKVGKLFSFESVH